MSDNQTNRLNEVLGEIEDELRGIQSAKEQVDAVLGANTELSQALSSLSVSLAETIAVTKASYESTADLLDHRTTAMSKASRSFDEMAKARVETFENHARGSQDKITQHLKQQTDENLRVITGAVDKGIKEISTAVNPLIDSLGISSGELKDLYQKSSSEQIQQSSNLLKKADEIAAQALSIQDEIAKIIAVDWGATRQDIERIDAATIELKEIALSQAAKEKKQFQITIGGLGACLVIGIICLVKLFTM